jgi:hypothetical protein
MTTKATTATGADNTPATPCDNHPERPATLSTDGDGRHSLINLCEHCVREFLPHRK